MGNIRASGKESEQPSFGIRESFDDPKPPRDLSETTGQDAMTKGSHCSILNVLFSIPAWLSRMRTTTLTCSSGVKNQAFVGESGKKNQKRTEVKRVRVPVMVTSHCQGSKPVVLMWRQPKASKPKKMMPMPFMRTLNRNQNKFPGGTGMGKNIHQYPVLFTCSVRV